MSYIQNGRHQDPPKEVFTIYLTDGMLYDRLNRYSQEYSVPVETLAELALKRFADDVDMFRSLRTGASYLFSSSK